MMFCGSLQSVGQSKKSEAPKRSLGIMQSSYLSLSTEEQDVVDRDLYGNHEPIEETEDFINDKLEHLKLELALLGDHITNPYNLAVNMEREQGNPKYVESRAFNLMFLRADRFDSRLAARRLARYFSEKLEIFGEETLARRLKLTDLNQHDMLVCNSGAICATGATDRTGRLLFFSHVVPHLAYTRKSPINLKRCIFYLVQNAIEKDEVSQRKGIVFVCYNLGLHMVPDIHETRKILSVLKIYFYALPVRVSGLHRCYDDLKVHLTLNFLLVAMPRALRARIHCHFAQLDYGRHEWCMLELAAYGINPDDLPLTNEGDIHNERISRSLNWHRELELE